VEDRSSGKASCCDSRRCGVHDHRDDELLIAKQKTPGAAPRLLVNILGKPMKKKVKQPHRGRGGSRHIGRIRIRLAEILSESLNLDCQPEDLSPTQGRYRVDKSWDVYAWEVFTQTKAGLTFVAGSWDTMTDCVKAGKVSISKGVISPEPNK
jgi:hypothetical protein